MKIVAVYLVAVAILNPAASDCDVCFHERCFDPTFFFDNRDLPASVTSVSNNGNVVYYRDGDDLKAINLDENTAVTVPAVAPVFNMAADVITGEVFYNTKDEYKVYRYNLKTNKTTAIEIPEPDTEELNPFKTWAYNGKVFFNKKRGSGFEPGLNFVSGSAVQKVSALDGVSVKDVVFAESGNMYITDNEKIYRLKTNQELRVLETHFTEDEIQMSGSANGDLYVFDTKKNLIYQLDPVTEKFNQVGGFLNPRSVNLASLDKDNNIIFRNYLSVSYYKVSSDRCVLNVEDGWNFSLSISKV